MEDLAQIRFDREQETVPDRSRKAIVFVFGLSFVPSAVRFQFEATEVN